MNGTCPSAAKSVLRPWQIPVCMIGVADAHFVLQGLPDGADLPHDVHLGEDIRFWQVASHLVLETIAQQKVMPGLVGRR